MPLKNWPALDLAFSPGRDVLLPDLVSATLDDFDCLAIEEQSERRWRVFFREHDERTRAAMALGRAFPPDDLLVAPVDVPDEDWARRSQEAVRAVRVGRVVVAPPWDLPDTRSPGDVLIEIEPSTGFGTGHHASTRLCLEAMQSLDLRDSVVVDLGTGSGVLAIAALRLGARVVFGVDVDRDAIDAARANLARNGLAETVDLHCADLRSLELPVADVLLANLTGALLERESDRILSAVRAEGSLILSGVGSHEAESVIKAFERGATVLERREEEGWVGLTLRRRL